MNPSFKPPPPISDKQRETIYRLYWLNPKKFNIRKLSQIFNISLKRVTAILRLKSLEKKWIKVSDVCHRLFPSFDVSLLTPPFYYFIGGQFYLQGLSYKW